MEKFTLSNQDMEEKQEPNKLQRDQEKELPLRTLGSLRMVLGGQFILEVNKNIFSDIFTYFKTDSIKESVDTKQLRIKPVR